jgi:hypothetical protein
MITNITYGTFLFLGSSLVVGILTVILFLPETKGLSLEEMDILFSIKGLAHQQRKKADAIIQDMRSTENLVGTGKEGLVFEQTEQA